VEFIDSPYDNEVAMGQHSHDNSQDEGQRVVQEAPVPEDEKFWRRYSPHHEFPLSSAASIALHLAAIAVLILGGVVAAKWGLGDSEKPLPISMMDEPGGGGRPEGNDAGTGAEGAVQSKEANESPSNAMTAASPTPKEDLQAPTPDPVDLPKPQDASARYIDESAEAMKGLAKLDEQTRKNLFNSLRDPPKGKGGSGSGGGKGSGTGTGTGSGKAQTEASLSKRQKRLLRWRLHFHTDFSDPGDIAQDYLRQWGGLGAILAIPDPLGKWYVFRDLSGRPPIGRMEDISAINNLWIGEISGDSLAAEIGRQLSLPFTARQMIFFVPRELEEHLKRLEEEFRGQKEDAIREKIHFMVVSRSGRCEVKIDPDQSRSDR
jgi:hypothetical protein